MKAAENASLRGPQNKMQNTTYWRGVEAGGSEYTHRSSPASRRERRKVKTVPVGIIANPVTGVLDARLITL
jgi:hypothetical protein